MAKVFYDHLDRSYFPDMPRRMMRGDRVGLSIYEDGYVAYVKAWREFSKSGVAAVPGNPYMPHQRQFKFWHDGFMDADQDCDAGLIKKVN